MPADIPSRKVDALVARLNTETSDQRVLTRNGGRASGIVPVYGWTGGAAPERTILGSATTEITDEGIVAHMTITPATAGRLIAREIHATIDVRDVTMSRVGDATVIDRWTIGGIQAGTAVPAWNDMWVREA